MFRFVAPGFPLSRGRTDIYACTFLTISIARRSRVIEASRVRKAACADSVTFDLYLQWEPFSVLPANLIFCESADVAVTAIIQTVHFLVGLM